MSITDSSLGVSIYIFFNLALFPDVSFWTYQYDFKIVGKLLRMRRGYAKALGCQVGRLL